MLKAMSKSTWWCFARCNVNCSIASKTYSQGDSVTSYSQLSDGMIKIN